MGLGFPAMIDCTTKSGCSFRDFCKLYLIELEINSTLLSKKIISAEITTMPKNRLFSFNSDSVKK